MRVQIVVYQETYMNNKLIIGVILGCSSVFSSVLFFNANKNITQEYFERFSQKLFPESNEISTTLKFSHKEDYVLIIRCKPNKYSSKKVLFNGNELSANLFPYKKISKNTEKNYILIPSRLVDSKKNVLKLIFSDKPPEEVSLKASNYRRSVLNSIYLLATESGYKVIATPDFFLHVMLTLILIMFLYIIPSVKTKALLKYSNFLFQKKPLNRKQILFFFCLITVFNISINWKSFVHLFRHDEWFFFFSSKNDLPDFSFLLKYFDWQLYLPYDKLMFRPLHHGTLAFNRVFFETNYIGPHILSISKHLLCCLCLWWLMYENTKRKVSILFVLLFSCLIVKIDPVIWPHLDAYITTTLFSLLAFIFFRKGCSINSSSVKYFLIASIILFLNILNTEIAFVVPFCLFFSYWFVCQKSENSKNILKNKQAFLVLLLPMGLWAMLFAIHIYAAYPNITISSQSSSVGLSSGLINIAKFIFLIIGGSVYPFTETWCSDKTYFILPVPGVIWTIFLIVILIRFKNKLFKPVSKDFTDALILVVAVSFVICFGRSSYVDSHLDKLMLPTHYTYFVTAMLIYMLYISLDFEKIQNNKTISIVFFVFVILLGSTHSFKTLQVNNVIENETNALKKYFNSVKTFVSEHKNEDDFSFKIVDRPPQIEVFNWYHQTCIDGLFDPYVSNDDPKYLLKYNYNSETLSCSVPDKRKIIIDPNISFRLPQPDYTNSLGMGFNKVYIRDKNIFIGTTEVTQEQWQAIMGSNPSRFIDKNRPVENISYRMAQEFINKLNAPEASEVYRLPTAKEYTYLVDLNFSAELDDQKLEKYGWLQYNAGQKTHSAGEREPMLPGVYDLIGNVWEWTSTPIHDGSPASSFEGNPRLCFGGSWRDAIKGADELVTNYPPEFRHEHLGFRLVRNIKDSKKKEE